MRQELNIGFLWSKTYEKQEMFWMFENMRRYLVPVLIFQWSSYSRINYTNTYIYGLLHSTWSAMSCSRSIEGHIHNISGSHSQPPSWLSILTLEYSWPSSTPSLFSSSVSEKTWVSSSRMTPSPRRLWSSCAEQQGVGQPVSSLTAVSVLKRPWAAVGDTLERGPVVMEELGEAAVLTQAFSR